MLGLNRVAKIHIPCMGNIVDQSQLYPPPPSGTMNLAIGLLRPVATLTLAVERSNLSTRSQRACNFDANKIIRVGGGEVKGEGEGDEKVNQ